MLPSTAAAANIHRLQGTAFINRHRARPNSIIRPGDLVTTSHNSSISFSVDGDAFLLKGQASLRIGAERSVFIDTLRLLTGKLLSVFESGRNRRIITARATIGIRGTGCFLNVQPRSLYYCNCYGQTDMHLQDHSEHFSATHHNAHEVKFDGDHFMGMAATEVKDHTDDELRMLEGLVGRVPAFDL
jgi:hypothetical protein